MPGRERERPEIRYLVTCKYKKNVLGLKDTVAISTKSEWHDSDQGIFITKFQNTEGKRKREESTGSQKGKTKPKTQNDTGQCKVSRIQIDSNFSKKKKKDSNLSITTVGIKSNKTMPSKSSDEINSNLFLC